MPIASQGTMPLQQSQVTTRGHATLTTAPGQSVEVCEPTKAGLSSLPSNDQLTMQSSTANVNLASGEKIINHSRVQSAVIHKRDNASEQFVPNVRSQAALLSDCSDGVVKVINQDMVDLRIKKNEVCGKQKYRMRSSKLPAYGAAAKRKLRVINEHAFSPLN